MQVLHELPASWRATPSILPVSPAQLVDVSAPTVARTVGLRYVRADQPGIRRARAGKGFRYTGADGRPVVDEAVLARIKRLAIPPAWTRVWICPHDDGHIQAVGRDAKGRKQYRYHPRWRFVRDSTKYERMIAFARALPRIRARVDEDLARPGLPREKVLATVVRLLEITHIRVGNEEYARKNQSYGLTTLRNDHAEVRGAAVRFSFRGKSGKAHAIDIRDRHLARIVKRCQDLPGEELFQYQDEDGTLRSIESGDVNEYLRAVAGEDFTAKDFRTWAGTVLACGALAAAEAFKSERAAKRTLTAAVKAVSERLGNTPAVCRKCYIHPAVVDRFLGGDLAAAVRAAVKDSGLPPEEAAVLGVLEAAADRRRRRPASPAAR